MAFDAVFYCFAYLLIEKWGYFKKYGKREPLCGRKVIKKSVENQELQDLNKYKDEENIVEPKDNVETKIVQTQSKIENETQCTALH